MNLLLIGPRACGKTTIGRLLAQRLQQPFIDLDDVARSHFCCESIQDIWARHGEQAWREAEVASLECALHSEHQVIALGGGTPMIERARELIESHHRDEAAKVIYLTCDANTLAARLIADPGDRPSLTGDGVAAEVATVLQSREPTYRALADFTCATDIQTPTEVVDQLMHWLGRDSPA